MTGAEIVKQGAGDGGFADAPLVGTDENDSWFGHGTPWMRDNLAKSEGRVCSPSSLSREKKDQTMFACQASGKINFHINVAGRSPLRSRRLRPVEQISRLHWKHRPSRTAASGPVCLLKGSRWHGPPSKHRAAGIPCAELSKGLAGVQTGIAAKMLSRLLIGVEDVKAVAIANLLDCCR
jgi:hypothetical protein